jgi:hypothetical protein
MEKHNDPRSGTRAQRGDILSDFPDAAPVLKEAKGLRKIIPKYLIAMSVKAKKKEHGKLSHGYMRHLALGGSTMSTFPGTVWDKVKKKRRLRNLGEK